MKTFCTYYNAGICRSCDVIELNDQEQISLKEKALLQSLAPAFQGTLDASAPSPTTGFRNKVKLAVTGSIDSPIIGLWGEDDLDLGREILACPLHHPHLIELTRELKFFITEAKLQPYSISQKKGELKGIILYLSQETGEIYLRLVMRSEEAVTRIQKFLPALLKKFPALKVVTVNVQPIAHALPEGLKEIFLTETKFLHHKMSHVELRLGTQGFVQTNQTVATRLYEEASSWVKESGIKKFAELFCGQGAFSFFCAPFVQEALGVEINQEAVNEANRSAKAKGLSHLSFKCADAATVSTEIKNFAPDLILVNPPRRGLAEAVKLLQDQKPEFIIYSSCDYETLGSDLEKLNSLYQVKRVKLFDMFPHTSHFETLVLLQRL